MLNEITIKSITPNYNNCSTPTIPNFILNNSSVGYTAKINDVIFTGNHTTYKTSIEEIKKEILDQLQKDYRSIPVTDYGTPSIKYLLRVISRLMYGNELRFSMRELEFTAPIVFGVDYQKSEITITIDKNNL
jgi:hypothetical protein